MADEDLIILDARKAKERERMRLWRQTATDAQKEAAAARGRRYAEKNKERRNAEAREYQRKKRAQIKVDPIKEAASKEWFANYRSKNRDSAIAYAKNYRATNRQKCREMERRYWEGQPGGRAAKNAAWAAKYPDVAKSHRTNRKAAVRGAQGKHTAKQIKALHKLQRAKCVYCGRSISKNWHVDHIMPIARGGGNDIKNIQLLCISCNLRKSAKHPVAFAQEIGLLL